MNAFSHPSFLRSQVLALVIAISLPARAAWLPFRIAFVDQYTDYAVFQHEAYDIYGLRLGLISVDKSVYGVSISLLSDGGTGFASDDRGRHIRLCGDEDFGGVKIGVWNALAVGSGFGVQAAFLTETGFRMTGVQCGVAESKAMLMNGVQISGILAKTDAEMHAMQLGGIVAECGRNAPEGADPSSTGLQVAGAVCLCEGTFSGIQIAGLYNFSETLNGMQIGLFNQAHHLRGFQIGLLNFSGTKEGGDFQCLPIINAAF